MSNIEHSGEGDTNPENADRTDADIPDTSEKDSKSQQRIEERRAIQSGSGKKSNNVSMNKAMLALFGLGAITFFIAEPSIIGLGDSDEVSASQDASEIGEGVLKREKERSPNPALSFDIPKAEKEQEPLEDPDKATISELKKLMESQKQGFESIFRSQKEALEGVRREAELEREKAIHKREQDEQKEQAKRRLEAKRRAAKLDDDKLREIHEKQVSSSGLVYDGLEIAVGAEQLISKTIDDPTAKDTKIDPGTYRLDENGRNAYGQELSSDQKFANAAANGGHETSRATDLGNLSRIIVQGTILSAVLETAINTELPGNVRAQISEPVYSYNGNRILMPSGTRLVGTFNPDIKTAQKRVLIAWNRAITPDGMSIAMGSTGSDRLGRSGTAGNIDKRLLQRYGSTALMSIIAAVPALLASQSQGSSNGGAAPAAGIQVGGGAQNGLGQKVGDSLAKQSKSAIEERFSLPPVIRVPQGEEIRVFVNRDLVF